MSAALEEALFYLGDLWSDMEQVEVLLERAVFHLDSEYPLLERYLQSVLTELSVLIFQIQFTIESFEETYTYCKTSAFRNSGFYNQALAEIERAEDLYRCKDKVFLECSISEIILKKQILKFSKCFRSLIVDERFNRNIRVDWVNCIRRTYFVWKYVHLLKNIYSKEHSWAAND